LGDYVRGSVVVVRLDARGTDERSRPCLVIQNDIGNQFSPLAIVVPLTPRQYVKRLFPLSVEIPASDGAIGVDSVADCWQIVSVDRSRIVKVLGRVSDQTMAAINRALEISLNLNQS
jgi:mRNA interferase MazF